MARDDNQTLFKVADMIRRVLDLTEPTDEILIGRSNILTKDYNKRLYVVDEIPSQTVMSSGERYDGEAEKMTFITVIRHDVTIDVYGYTAYSDASRLVALLRSQAASDAKIALGLTSFHVSSKTDLKELTGTQYINRVQLACIVHDTETVEIDTLRIDTARMQIRNEKGIFYDSESE